MSTTDRNRCLDVLDALDTPHPRTVEELLASVERARGKHVQLVPAAFAATAPCGMLVGTDEADFICYAANTSSLHRVHIVLHEVGHLLYGHRGYVVPTAGDQAPVRAESNVEPQDGGDAAELDDVALDALTLLLPDLPAPLIERIFGRTVFDDEDEREAELFADMARARIAHARRTPEWARHQDRTLVRLRQVFDAPATSVNRG